MPVEPLGRRFVVVGADHQRGVGAGFLGELGQADRLAGGVRAGPRHHLDFSPRGANHLGDDLVLLLVREGRRLAGRSGGNQNRGPGVDLELNLLGQAVKVNLPLFERGDHRHRQSGEIFTAGLHAYYSQRGLVRFCRVDSAFLTARRPRRAKATSFRPPRYSAP